MEAPRVNFKTVLVALVLMVMSITIAGVLLIQWLW